MASSRLFQRRLFNDGEGLDFNDINDLQEWIQDDLRYRGIAGVHEIGGMLSLANSACDPREKAASPLSLLGALNGNPYLFMPHGLAGGSQIANTGPGNIDIHGGYGTIWVQRRQTSATGSAPPGASDGTKRPDGQVAGDFYSTMVYSSTDEDPIFALDTANNPTTNPRIDSIGIRLNHDEGPNVTRDFEDAVTRAKTTTSLPKTRGISLEAEFVQGAEAASPVLPSLTTGFSRWISVRRNVGQTHPIPLDQWQANWMPMRMGAEWQPGSDGWALTADWDRENVGDILSAVKVGGPNNNPLYYTPRNMPNHARLVGFGFNSEIAWTNDIAIWLGYIDHNGSFTAVEDIGSGNVIGTSAGDGFHFAGLADFLQPWWGNGRPFGPLFDFRSDSTALDTALAGNALTGSSRLCVRFGGSGSNIISNESVTQVTWLYMV